VPAPLRGGGSARPRPGVVRLSRRDHHALRHRAKLLRISRVHQEFLILLEGAAHRISQPIQHAAFLREFPL